MRDLTTVVYLPRGEVSERLDALCASEGKTAEEVITALIMAAPYTPKAPEIRCAVCGRARSAFDFDYDPLQVVYAAEIGWHTSDEDEPRELCGRDWSSILVTRGRG